jgi:3-hydroxyisobutyrate dehydrogenase-like beta-hydroxyacid dehydrogenase
MSNPHMSKPRCGFIGVGLMGQHMARNLIEKGFALTILGNRNRAPVEMLLAKGASEAKTAAQVAQASDILFLCVTDSTTVEAIIRGENGIKAGAHAGLVVVDCSTSNPVSTMALAAELKALGVELVDAPLGGTPSAAETGSLLAMVGAEDAVLARIRPAIEAWAGRIEHVGPVGNGHKMKLLNNFLSMSYAALYSEAFALARKSGIGMETVNKVVSGGRMDCGFFQTFVQYSLNGEPNAHKFALTNGYKDMRYVEAMGEAVRLHNPIANAVKNSFALAEAAGRGQDYVPLLAEVIADLNGIPRAKHG